MHAKLHDDHESISYFIGYVKIFREKLVIS